MRPLLHFSIYFHLGCQIIYVSRIFVEEKKLIRENSFLYTHFNLFLIFVYSLIKAAAAMRIITAIINILAKHVPWYLVVTGIVITEFVCHPQILPWKTNRLVLYYYVLFNLYLTDTTSRFFFFPKEFIIFIKFF